MFDISKEFSCTGAIKGAKHFFTTSHTEAKNLACSNRSSETPPKCSLWALLISCKAFHTQPPHHSQGCCDGSWLVSMMLGRVGLWVFLFWAHMAMEEESWQNQNHWLSISSLLPEFVIFPLPMQVLQRQVVNYSGIGNAVHGYMVPFSMSP